MMQRNLFMTLFSGSLSLLLTLTPGTPATADEIVLYSGRSKSLVNPIIQAFERDSGHTVVVKYGQTSQLALALQEEGAKTPADVFWAQDAGALGAIADAGMFAELPATTTGLALEQYRNPDSLWVATSGRGRTLAYSTERADSAEIPASVFDLTDEKYKNRVGWAPANASFQAFVTAMRVTHGDDTTRQWLKDMKANGTKSYAKNTPILHGIASGEIDFGLPNHYYLIRIKLGDKNFPVNQTHFAAGDVGNLLNVAGVGVIKHTKRPDAANELAAYLLSDKAQTFFAQAIPEYPVTDNVISNAALEPQAELIEISPSINLDDLADLAGTLAMLREEGLL